MYRIDDLQATEPSALNWRAGVDIDIADERDSMGFDRVTLTAKTPGELVAFIATHWGRSDPAWFTETLQTMYEVDPAEMLEPEDAPEGFRRIRFVSSEDTGDQTWEGIVRKDAGAYVYPFVSPGTARALAAELQSFYATPRDAHGDDVLWFDVQPHWQGCPDEFVVYAPDGRLNPRTNPSAYGADGFPHDPDAWGTLNLCDEQSYRERFPAGSKDAPDGDGAWEWVDLGALGLVWVELPTVLNAEAQDALSEEI